ncbi:hypothetical protein YC2023_033048 [Brassica napus]
MNLENIDALNSPEADMESSRASGTKTNGSDDTEGESSSVNYESGGDHNNSFTGVFQVGVPASINRSPLFPLQSSSKPCIYYTYKKGKASFLENHPSSLLLLFFSKVFWDFALLFSFIEVLMVINLFFEREKDPTHNKKLSWREATSICLNIFPVFRGVATLKVRAMKEVWNIASVSTGIKNSLLLKAATTLVMVAMEAPVVVTVARIISW